MFVSICDGPFVRNWEGSAALEKTSIHGILWSFCDVTHSKDSAVCNTRYGDCAVAGFTQKNFLVFPQLWSNPFEKSLYVAHVALQRGSLSAFIDMAGTLDSNTRPVLSTNAKPEPSTLKDCPRSMVGGHLTMGNYKRFHHRIDGSRPFTKENHIGWCLSGTVTNLLAPTDFLWHK